MLEIFWIRHPDAKTNLQHWLKVAREADWQNLNDVRGAFPHADPVTTGSGRSAIIFNICGNKYRLLAAIHFNRRTIYTLMVLTHAEYSKGQWREIL